MKIDDQKVLIISWAWLNVFSFDPNARGVSAAGRRMGVRPFPPRVLLCLLNHLAKGGDDRRHLMRSRSRTLWALDRAVSTSLPATSYSLHHSANRVATSIIHVTFNTTEKKVTKLIRRPLTKRRNPRKLYRLTSKHLHPIYIRSMPCLYYSLYYSLYCCLYSCLFYSLYSSLHCHTLRY